VRTVESMSMAMRMPGPVAAIVRAAGISTTMVRVRHVRRTDAASAADEVPAASGPPPGG
jgi:hypothetical protein